MVADHQIKVRTNNMANSQKQVIYTDMPSIVHYFIVVDEVGKDGFFGGVSKSMLKKNRLAFDKIVRCK